MTKLQTYLLRFQAMIMAIFVAMLSMGFTYNWEVCKMQSQEVVHCSSVETSSCCCAAPSQAPICACATLSHNSCDLSFSKYIQFTFEAPSLDVQEILPEFNIDIIPFSHLGLDPCEEFLSTYCLLEEISLPPPKSGRDILCDIQVFII